MNVKYIIVHCSATAEGKDFTVADITRWHKQQGFDTIGYHYVIYRDGTIHEGRDINVVGAHCKGYNSCSVGVCYVGGVVPAGGNLVKSKDTRTPEQKEALITLLKLLKLKWPKAKICGHRDFAAKDCPCFDATKEYANL